jgi:hypothetical protein
VKIQAIQCNAECEDIIYSRAGHDFRWCSCKHCAIDGGRNYTKVTGLFFTHIEIEVDATEKELYDDYNYSGDKYGKISKSTNGQDIKNTKSSQDIPTTTNRKISTVRNNKTANSRQKNKHKDI